jgi:cyclopropane fatty-acyl-phospholipid synthase-like methyltransferase
LRTLDHEQFAQFRLKYQSTDFGESKHWKLQERIAINLRHALLLNLHRTKPLQILDIGAGCGYFPFICTYYGHEAMAIDLNIAMYREITQWLGVPWEEHKVNAYQPLPTFGRKFDLITALLIYFNNPESPSVWGIEEWRFFLTDLVENHLTPAGQIYLTLNRDCKHRFYDEGLYNFFIQTGAKVKDGMVHLQSVKHLRRIPALSK